MVRSGVNAELIVVGSVAVSLAVLVSPPPETVTELTTETALADTLTVSVMAGKLAPAASTVLLVQGPAGCVQTQFVPEMDVAVRPAGTVSDTETAAVVAAVPELVTVMV